MPLDKKLIKKLVKEALLEDAAYSDITTLDFIPSQARVQAQIVAKKDGVLCGLPLAFEVFKSFDKSLRLKAFKLEGRKIKKGTVLLTIEGTARSVLSCERVALNFLSYLSGISSEVFRAVAHAKAKGIQILDTRKTTPTLRVLEKYAVLMGGGNNHRLDLKGQYMVKDNHVFILEKTHAIDRLAEKRRNVPLEIEVQNMRELKRAILFSPDIVLLDNFSPEGIREALVFLKKMFPNERFRPLIELSGGIDLKNLSRFCVKGVDFISIGALTHSAPALDISLEIVKVYSR